jgi:saccharopine dehydrogenase-like NADP-dependent oxidoreductase
LKNILLLGAGKSATVLIDYLLQEADTEDWYVIVADANKDIIEEKTKKHELSLSVELDIKDEEKRQSLIQFADVVISMLPPALHILVAKDCLLYEKNLLTASYADDSIKSLDTQAKEKNILFLCEMGLDPGIDHMSALPLIHHIKESGGKIVSFKSHCGGLVAPESDNNPWRYKISWNPRNVVLAGKSGAVYKEENKVVEEKYEHLFDSNRMVSFENEGARSFSYYPNRNSLSYIELYGLQDSETFIRTTLRYPEFMKGWKQVIDLHLTDEQLYYDTNDKTLRDFFTDHFKRYKIDRSKIQSKQLYFLGIDDDETLINKGLCSAADVLQFCLEEKIVLEPQDKDMIVMLHEIEYLKDGIPHSVKSSLIVTGEDSKRTAMAKTVGLPLGIAAKLILNDKIQLKGVQIPVIKEIYEPVMDELMKYDIRFLED